ncbi:MAG: deoxyribose-phosphate aldolase [Bacillales bacterium]|nr:deoxyribose-phosphate aldolase [Bacillales bacterium]
MNYAKYIDHTLLKPDCKDENIEKLCNEARNYGFKSVCINPSYIPLCKKLLEGSDVLVCTVVGFPLGATSTYSKVEETKKAVDDGADEIDMVINISRLKEKDDAYTLNEIKAIKQACQGRTLKVIIETCLLSEEEKVRACLLAKEAGADFVKTSTGFSTGGATKEDIALMRKTVGPDMGVKASGGVRDAQGFMDMVNAGATRIGASAGIKIMEELNKKA